MKRWMSAAMAVLIVSAAVGCVREAKPTESETVHITEESIPTITANADGELLIYLDASNQEYMSGLIVQFQTEYPDIKVIVEDYSDMIIDDYRTMLAEHLAAGDGPDLILTSHNYFNAVQNLTEQLQDGRFLDVRAAGLQLSGADALAAAADSLVRGSFSGAVCAVYLST